MKPAFTCATVVCLAALVARGAAAGEPASCDFDIVGTWEASSTDDAPGTRYHFRADGMVSTLSRQGTAWSETAGSTFEYRLDDPRAPKRIELIAEGGSVVRGSMEIVRFDDGTFSTATPDEEPTRWVRVDAQQHYVVFAAAKGTLVANGPAFVMLARKDRSGSAEPMVAGAFGFHMAGDARTVGPVPAEVQRRFRQEPKDEGETLLRLEVSPREFQRALAVVRTWERRARERTLLYEIPHLNNMVFLEEVAKSLNTCGERIRLHDLNWRVDDPVVGGRDLSQISYHYIRALRELNEVQHVKDAGPGGRLSAR